jgi:hypothetical protein
VFARALAQHTAQRRHVLVEVVLLDDDVGPDRLHQRSLLDELPGVLDQIEQGLEHLRGQCDGLAVDARAQQPLGSIDTEFTELVGGTGAALHRGPSGNFRRLHAAAKDSSDPRCDLTRKPAVPHERPDGSKS